MSSISSKELDEQALQFESSNSAYSLAGPVVMQALIRAEDLPDCLGPPFVSGSTNVGWAAMAAFSSPDSDAAAAGSSSVATPESTQPPIRMQAASAEIVTHRLDWVLPAYLPPYWPAQQPEAHQGPKTCSLHDALQCPVLSNAVPGCANCLRHACTQRQ